MEQLSATFRCNAELARRTIVGALDREALNGPHPIGINGPGRSVVGDGAPLSCISLRLSSAFAGKPLSRDSVGQVVAHTWMLGCGGAGQARMYSPRSFIS